MLSFLSYYFIVGFMVLLIMGFYKGIFKLAKEKPIDSVLLHGLLLCGWPFIVIVALRGDYD